MSLTDLPALNATLNALSATCLLLGLFFIRRGQQKAHRSCMLTALAASAIFLASYLYYHFHAGRTVFRDPAWFRPIYLILLLTHTVLAVVILPLIAVTLTQALRGAFGAHKRIARWTWPLWMYVSVTGVVIYLLLYQIFPQKQPSGEAGGVGQAYNQFPPDKGDSSRARKRAAPVALGVHFGRPR